MARCELQVASDPAAAGRLAYGRKPEAWDEEAADGSVTRYETVCTLMGKQLP